ncbi:MAG: LuxR C-terminal-related transcriptional regulator [Dyadobacter sp.]|uniref:helix-turn-helix transcriptional regulator n=1 Tax=Dyadobacter sp. TaxID=1914288 RepID=UPI00326633B2
MEKENTFDLSSFRKIWKSDVLESDIAEISGFLNDSPLLREALNVRNSSLAIIDLKRMVYISCIGESKPVCGWDTEVLLKGGVGFFLSNLKPADFDGLQVMSSIMTDHVSGLSTERLKTFKALFDFQMVGEDGSINRVVQEGVSLKRNSDGHIVFLLALISNITSMKRENRQHLRLTDQLEDLIFEVNNETGKCRRLENLSRRELQIARLIGKQLTSEEIAKSLFISVHTVNTHRQNMLKKLDMGDTMELLNFLTAYHLI